MNRVLLVLAFAILLTAGCWETEEAPEPKSKKVQVGKNIWVEIMPDRTRRVLVSAEVCLREGPLELVLTRKHKKEHEAIFSTEVDARQIHTALITAGAAPGKPATFLPDYIPAHGAKVDVEVRFTSPGGNQTTMPAGYYVRDIRTNTQLGTTWVFGGSRLIQDQFSRERKKVYLANMGDVICLVNMEDGMLDVPFSSSKADDDRGFEAWTERIPPLGTKVTLILTPVKK